MVSLTVCLSEKNAVMKLKIATTFLILIALGACSDLPDGATPGEFGDLKPASEAVVALAAPYQNLNLVILKPEDGCFWYLHDGPVEMTLLPLRTAKGGLICTQSRPEAAVQG